MISKSCQSCYMYCHVLAMAIKKSWTVQHIPSILNSVYQTVTTTYPKYAFAASAIWHLSEDLFCLNSASKHFNLIWLIIPFWQVHQWCWGNYKSLGIVPADWIRQMISCGTGSSSAQEVSLSSSFSLIKLATIFIWLRYLPIFATKDKVGDCRQVIAHSEYPISTTGKIQLGSNSVECNCYQCAHSLPWSYHQCSICHPEFFSANAGLSSIHLTTLF